MEGGGGEGRDWNDHPLISLISFISRWTLNGTKRRVIDDKQERERDHSIIPFINILDKKNDRLININQFFIKKIIRKQEKDTVDR